MNLTYYRGLERIRTAVGAFAELSLTARPRDPFSETAKIASIRENWKKVDRQ